MSSWQLVCKYVILTLSVQLEANTIFSRETERLPLAQNSPSTTKNEGSSHVLSVLIPSVPVLSTRLDNPPLKPKWLTSVPTLKPIPYQ